MYKHGNSRAVNARLGGVMYKQYWAVIKMWHQPLPIKNFYHFYHFYQKNYQDTAADSETEYEIAAKCSIGDCTARKKDY